MISEVMGNGMWYVYLVISDIIALLSVAALEEGVVHMGRSVATIVTGRTRREMCGSMCKALFKDVFTNRHGSVNSKQT